MKMDGVEVDIDVHDYLVAKGLSRVRTVGDNVMACCPFHNERSPSFGVSIYSGAFNCFGCGAKGTFPSLVKQLDRFETVHDAQQFLLYTYGRFTDNSEVPTELHLDELLDDTSDKTSSTDTYELDERFMSVYKWRHPYLSSRGISERWQRLFEIGYSKRSSAITIPWRSEDGRLLTFKLRSVAGKRFWYDPPMPDGLKGRTWFALDKVLRWGVKTVAITEAEIDCMSVWAAERVGAIAIGGNQPTVDQTNKLIRLLPSDCEIIMFTDNDEGGRIAREILCDRLSGRFRLSEVDWALGGDAKDATDLSLEKRIHVIENRIPLGLRLHLAL